MKQWNVFGLTAIVLLIPMLFIYYSVRSGTFHSATGIPFFTCLDSEVCPDIPRRNYNTVQLPLENTFAEAKLKDQIQMIGQIRDTTRGYYIALNDVNTYDDFIKGIDLCNNSVGVNMIHNESGLWVYYPSKRENEAFFEKLRKEYPQLGPPMTCK